MTVAVVFFASCFLLHHFPVACSSREVVELASGRAAGVGLGICLFIREIEGSGWQRLCGIFIRVIPEHLRSLQRTHFLISWSISWYGRL